MRRRTKSTTLALGTISEGTLRPEDLIPAYLSALEDLRLSKAERATLRTIQREQDRPETADIDHDVNDLDQWHLDELTTILEAHCPDYAYFGSLEGDGACFGVCASIPDAFDDDVYRSADPPSTTKPFQRALTIQSNGRIKHEYNGQGFWLHINDHGNATLYRRSSNRWIEVWSVV